MPLLNMACPNCLKTLHTDEVWFDHPATGDRRCHSCSHNIGEHTAAELRTLHRLQEARENAENLSLTILREADL